MHYIYLCKSRYLEYVTGINRYYAGNDDNGSC